MVSIWSNVCVSVSDDADPDPDGRLTGFAKAPSGATKVYWRQLNSKRSLPVLEWTSESEYLFEAKSNHFTPSCACAARGNKFCFPAPAV